jgi:predicted MarR family transcription regulator
MTHTESLLSQYKVILESRLTRVETQHHNMADDIKDIKKTLHWLTGIVFSINTAVLGVVTKGFGIF